MKTEVEQIREYVLKKRAASGVGMSKPRYYWSDPVEVGVYFDSMTFLKLDELAETLTLVPDLKITWWDPNWEYKNFILQNNISQIDYLNFEPTLSWKPSVLHMNNAFDVYAFARVENGMRVMYIKPSGFVEYYPTIEVVTTKCNLDFRQFPFDRQRCAFQLGLIDSCVDAALVKTGFRRDPRLSVSSNDGWEIYDYHVLNTSTDSCASFRGATEFVLMFKRRPAPFIANAFLPLVFLTIIQLGTLGIPADTGERAAFSATVQLALGVIQSSVKSMMPFSAHVSYLEMLIISMLVSSTFMTIYAALSSLYYNHFIKQRNKFQISKSKASKPTALDIEETLKYDKYLKYSDCFVLFVYVTYALISVPVLVTFMTEQVMGAG